MRLPARLFAVAAATLTLGTSITLEKAHAQRGAASKPLTIASQGSFFVGGEKKQLPALPAGSGAAPDGGNSHMLMQDKNNLELADLIIDWIDEHAERS